MPSQCDVCSLAPCNHEEADSHMMLHIAHATRHGRQKILVRTVDTDVVVLAVMVAGRLSPEHEVWLAFGTGKNFCYLSAYQIAVSRGPEKSLALPMFHALTSCDTVSGFVGHGKKTSWSTWNAFPELTDALLELAHVPTEVTEQSMKVIERFIVLLLTEQTLGQGQEEDVCQNIICAKDSTNTCCSGAAYKLGSFSRGAYPGPST